MSETKINEIPQSEHYRVGDNLQGAFSQPYTTFEAERSNERCSSLRLWRDFMEALFHQKKRGLSPRIGIGCVMKMRR